METVLEFIESQPAKSIAVVAILFALIFLTRAMRRHWRRNLAPFVSLEPGVPSSDAWPEGQAR